MYMSKVLNDIERNYDVHNKEMLVIMQGLGGGVGGTGNHLTHFL